LKLYGQLLLHRDFTTIIIDETLPYNIFVEVIVKLPVYGYKSLPFINHLTVVSIRSSSHRSSFSDLTNAIKPSLSLSLLKACSLLLSSYWSKIYVSLRVIGYWALQENTTAESSLTLSIDLELNTFQKMKKISPINEGRPNGWVQKLRCLCIGFHIQSRRIWMSIIARHIQKSKFPFDSLYRDRGHVIAYFLHH